jgi:hypothetical protein
MGLNNKMHQIQPQTLPLVDNRKKISIKQIHLTQQ